MSSERIISADSHVNPPKDLWTREAPDSIKDRVPRVESTDQGDFWIVDSQISGAIGLDSSAGRKPEDFKAFGLGYKDMRPGSYDPKARLEDMDLDGVDAEVLYVGGPLLTADTELRLASFRGYNQWLADFSAHAPKRLLGMGAVPVDSPDLAAEFVRTIKGLGLAGAYIPSQ